MTTCLACLGTEPLGIASGIVGSDTNHWMLIALIEGWFEPSFFEKHFFTIVLAFFLGEFYTSKPSKLFDGHFIGAKHEILQSRTIRCCKVNKLMSHLIRYGLTSFRYAVI